MSASSSIFEKDSIVTLGNQQFKIIGKAGKSFAGSVWEVHPIKENVTDPTHPFIIKFDWLYNPIFRGEAEFKRCQEEAEKQSQSFESAVYWLNGYIVILEPKLPGHAILDISGSPIHPNLEDLTLSERLELNALLGQTYFEFHLNGSLHIDLNPSNVLIAIKRIKGKACFQCNPIDFTDGKKFPITTAPETLFSEASRSVKSDTYLLTPIMATILGEYNVFQYKWKVLQGSNLELGTDTEKAPFCLTGMGAYLIEELFNLQKNQFSKEEISNFINMGMRKYLTEELFKMGVFNLSEDELFKIVCSARSSYLSNKLDGTADENSGSMKPHLIKALFESPKNNLSQDEITTLINNNERISGFIDDELFIWIDAVTSIISRMGSKSPNNRPGELTIIKVMNTAALVCREREIAIIENEKDKEAEGGIHESSIEIQQNKLEYGIPVRNHLLVERGLNVVSRVYQNILQKAKQINSDTSKRILSHAIKLTEDSTSIAIIKEEANKAIGRAEERHQSIFGFFYADNNRLYQEIINIIEKYEQQKMIGMAILAETDKIDLDIGIHMRKLAEKLIVGNGNEKTIEKIRDMAQAVIDSAEKPGEEHIPIYDYIGIYQNIVRIIDVYTEQPSESAQPKSSPAITL